MRNWKYLTLTPDDLQEKFLLSVSATLDTAYLEILIPKDECFHQWEQQ